MSAENHKHTNSLINQSSPYLLQHAHNPVNWFAWGDEAFTKAEYENKLIFLSIGYSTCHWCHVMEKESFEDEEVADLLNRAYVSIKVDREERPDLDAFFMEAAMLMNRQGGWPLNLILTPEQKPFFAATYIPKNGNSYSAGLIDLLPQIESMWKKTPQRLIDSAAKVLDALKSGEPAGALVDLETELAGLRSKACRELSSRYDADYGGFGKNPKFPQPHNLLLLMREYSSSGDEKVLEIVENTLKQMRAGGVFDQIGFGFHRYSTDKKWLLPHFEKMLYDQAMLVIAYTEAYQLTDKSVYRSAAEEIIDYVLRDMRSPGGAFYSAEDADSEGREGQFYIWKYDEFTELLEKNGYNGRFWADYFKLEPGGNFTDESAGVKTGENILHVSPDSRMPEGLADVRKLLFNERERRIHPHKDDKILTDWNGLFITALAKAGWVFNCQDYINTAEKVAGFIVMNMKQDDGSLLHTYRSGKMHTKGMIDDYAFLIRALLELYRAEFKPGYLKQAVSLAEYAQQNFEDKDHGGFFTSDKKQTDLPVRKKNVMDNAYPSGSSIMYENLMQLFKITGENGWRDSAEGVLRSAAASGLENYPQAFSMLVSAFAYSGQNGCEIVVTGSREAAEALLAEINSSYLPGTVVILKTTENAESLTELAPYTGNYRIPEKAAAAYICTNFTCRKPVFDLTHVL